MGPNSAPVTGHHRLHHHHSTFVNTTTTTTTTAIAIAIGTHRHESTATNQQQIQIWRIYEYTTTHTTRRLTMPCHVVLNSVSLA
jgi:hypothetical protein